MSQDPFCPREDISLKTAQLIGALVVRLVFHARSINPTLGTFPDAHLIQCILKESFDPADSEAHLVELLFHLTKILDNCTPRKALPPPKWELVKK
jgi:hypothetical protein